MSLLHEIETRIASLETEAANFKAEIERCNREEASARTAKDGRAMALARSQIGAFGELLQEAETALSEARAEHRALAEPIWLRATRRIDGIYSTAAETAIVQALAAVGVKSSFHLKAGMPEMIAEALAEIPKPPVSANSASIAKAERFIAQIDGRTLAEIRQAASKF